MKAPVADGNVPRAVGSSALAKSSKNSLAKAEPGKIEALNPRGNPPPFQVVVIGGQTNPYYPIANMSYSRSISIDKWA